MTEHVWHTGVFGTFDVQNYGDLLFPLIAQAELTKRLGSVKVRPFSYHAKKPPEWPYTVTSVTELPQMVDSLDGVLLGGGHLIRFDKEVAPAYGPPTPTIHHPTGYWLTPALIALQQGIPVIWNAPGTYGPIPTWAQPLMKLSVKLSSYVAVRDEPSRSALTHLADGAPIDVTPDTAFGISWLLDDERPTAEFTRLRENSGLTGPYIVVQATPGIKRYKRFLQRNSHLFRDFRLLALPIGPVLGDDEAILADLPGLVRLSKWPHPLLLAEIISQASGVVGRSYHLMITALAFGVPVFSIADLSLGKHSALSTFKTIYSPPPKGSQIDPEWFFTRLGKTAPSPEALAALDQLSAHWDRVAAAIRNGPTATQATLNRFWQSLPALLEHSDDLSKLLTLARADVESREFLIGQRDEHIALLDGHIAHRDEHIALLDGRIAHRDEHIALLDGRTAPVSYTHLTLPTNSRV
jgi:lipopolysaccharide transport system ATP-binding protein